MYIYGEYTFANCWVVYTYGTAYISSVASEGANWGVQSAAGGPNTPQCCIIPKPYQYSGKCCKKECPRTRPQVSTRNPKQFRASVHSQTTSKTTQHTDSIAGRMLTLGRTATQKPKRKTKPSLISRGGSKPLHPEE